MKKMVKDKYTS
uniref:Uncharacterized protein n=1 Tax=Rhizophora mucronata TaxID=61149 RepID=A0A2P2R2S4_RHIMU